MCARLILRTGRRILNTLEVVTIALQCLDNCIEHRRCRNPTRPEYLRSDKSHVPMGVLQQRRDVVRTGSECLAFAPLCLANGRKHTAEALRLLTSAKPVRTLAFNERQIRAYPLGHLPQVPEVRCWTGWHSYSWWSTCCHCSLEILRSGTLPAMLIRDTVQCKIICLRCNPLLSLLIPIAIMTTTPPK